MIETINEIIEDEGLATVRPILHLDSLGEAPALRAAIEASRGESWIAPVLDIFRRELPVPPTCLLPFTGRFFRLPMHRRCFYYTADEAGGKGVSPRGVIAIKGMEPLVSDCDAWLAEMTRTPMDADASTQRNVAEHFALYEHKVPGALSLREAETEARIATEVQEKHLHAYGTLARLPLSLLVHRLPEESLDNFFRSIRRHLSSRALARLEGQLSGGLAAYLYYYPNTPVRVTQTDLMLPGKSYHERAGALRQWVREPGLVVSGWVETFVRLLLLGYVPAALGSRGIGNCCSPDNSVVDGGFVDLDSLIPTTELADDALFDETLHYSFLSLSRTVRTFLVKAQPRRSQERDLVEKWIGEYVAVLCRQALESEHRPGLTPDPRIGKYFAAPLTYQELTARFANYFPAPHLDTSAQEYLDQENSYQNLIARFARYFPRLP